MQSQLWEKQIRLLFCRSDLYFGGGRGCQILIKSNNVFTPGIEMLVVDCITCSAQRI